MRGNDPGRECGVFVSSLRRQATAALVSAFAALALAGCVEEAADLQAKADAHTQLTRRPDVSIADASVAFVSVEGAPAAIAASFNQEMIRQAAARDIVVVDAKKAHYLVRGYLSAYATADGAAVEYVWDIFAKDKQRMQRVNDVLEVKGQGDDPWTVAGPAALASVAAKSADDLAAYLSYTPEAVALAKSSENAAQADAAAAKPLSYAPLQ
jgi:hypothetical protein